MAALQDAWEGQPDLSLPAFLSMLAHRGMSWSTSEEELLALLDDLRCSHPAVIDSPPAAPTLLTTDQPRMVVTLTRFGADSNGAGGPCLVARNAEDPQRMPAVWRYSALLPTGPGRPLVVADEEGVEHRLGVVERASSFADGTSHANGISGLASDEIGSSRWLLLFADGTRGILGPRLRLWQTQGRETVLTTSAWERVEEGAPGRDMVIAPAGGGKHRRLGLLQELLLLER